MVHKIKAQEVESWCSQLIDSIENNLSSVINTLHKVDSHTEIGTGIGDEQASIIGNFTSEDVHQDTISIVERKGFSSIDL